MSKNSLSAECEGSFTVSLSMLVLGNASKAEQAARAPEGMQISSVESVIEMIIMILDLFFMIGFLSLFVLLSTPRVCVACKLYEHYISEKCGLSIKTVRRNS